MTEEITSNRTSVELKPRSVIPSFSPASTSNRTSVELKPIARDKADSGTTVSTSNRTSVELKLSLLSIFASSRVPLIEPVWN